MADPEGRRRTQGDHRVWAARPLLADRRVARLQWAARRRVAAQPPTVAPQQPPTAAPQQPPTVAPQQPAAQQPRVARPELVAQPPPAAAPQAAAEWPRADPPLRAALPQLVEAPRLEVLGAGGAARQDWEVGEDLERAEAPPDRPAEARQGQEGRSSRGPSRGVSRRDIPRRLRINTPCAHRRPCPAASVPAAALGQSASHVTSGARRGTTL